VAALEADSKSEREEIWKFLISALSGSLCASFEGMDADHDSYAWVTPLDTPWANDGETLRFSTLPYEPVCTENLTPWLKLLPCGWRRGLAALIAPIAVAESPLASLSLAGVVNRDTGRIELRASLDVILPLMERSGLRAWFDTNAVENCEASSSFHVRLVTKTAPAQSVLEAEIGYMPPVLDLAKGSQSLEFTVEQFAGLQAPWKLPVDVDRGHKPWGAKQGKTEHRQDTLAVMRDILAQDGKSERTHGRYLLRFTNEGLAQRRVRFMDQLPFFIRPLWHTFRITWGRHPGSESHLQGIEAMEALSLQFIPSVGHHSPTELFLEVELEPSETMSVFMDVQKRFIQLREFSFACEKGFDVGSAAWLEQEVPARSLDRSLDRRFQEQWRCQEERHRTLDDFVASLASSDAAGRALEATRWDLHFTEGLLVLLPMPDFSMPFNVIALSSTALTFFFGSMFRLSATARAPHWVLKKEEKKSTAAIVRQKLPLVLLIGLAYGLTFTEEKQLLEIRDSIPPAAGPLIDMLVWTRATLLGEVSEGGH